MWDSGVFLSLTYYWRGESRPPAASAACFSVCFPGEQLRPLLNMGDTVSQCGHSPLMPLSHGQRLEARWSVQMGSQGHHHDDLCHMAVSIWLLKGTDEMQGSMEL